MKMDTLYANSDEKFVKSVVLYAKSADKHLCVNLACDEADRIDAVTLMNLLLKGDVVVVYDDSNYYTPISFKVDVGGVIKVVIATGDTALTGVTLTSRETDEEG